MNSDSELKRDVENELKWEPSVNEAHIGVSVEGGVVTLSGHVPAFGEKYSAEKAAKRVYGVKAVVDQLEVKLPGQAKRTDQDIAQACLSALKNNYAVPDEAVQVVVHSGRVTLEGEVEWDYQRTAAQNAVRFLTGVTSITNQLKLKPRISSKDVKDKIVAAFHRYADIDARRIHIDSHDGTVVLSGNVRSWFEREQAQNAAWAAPGVVRVDNELAVVP